MHVNPKLDIRQKFDRIDETLVIVPMFCNAAVLAHGRNHAEHLTFKQAS